MSYYGYIPRRHARKIEPWIMRLQNATDGLQEDMGIQDTSEVLESLADVSFWRGRVMGDLLSAGMTPASDPQLSEKVFKALAASHAAIGEAHAYLLQRMSPSDLGGFEYVPNSWNSYLTLDNGLSSLVTKKNRMMRGQSLTDLKKTAAAQTFVRGREDIDRAASWVIYLAVAQTLYSAANKEDKGKYVLADSWKSFWGTEGSPGWDPYYSWKDCSGYRSDMLEPSPAWMTDALICLYNTARTVTAGKIGKATNLAGSFVKFLMQEYLTSDVNLSDADRKALMKIAGHTLWVPREDGTYYKVRSYATEETAAPVAKKETPSVQTKTPPSYAPPPASTEAPTRRRRKKRTGARKGRRKGKRKGKKKQESWWAKNWWIPVAATSALAATVIIVRTGRSR